MTVSVIRLAAIGAMTLQRMLYLRPSFASVSVKPTRASFAAGRISRHFKECYKVHTRVVGLSKRAKQASSRRRANQASVLLFPEVRPCRVCALVCSLDVNIVDEVPVRLLHVLEADISQDAGIVDENINATKGINGRFDDSFSILDRIVVADGLAACGADLFDDLVCCLVVVVSFALLRFCGVRST